MAIPDETSATEAVTQRSLYVSAIVAADPATAGLQKGVDAADAKLRAAAVARSAADEALTRAEAQRDYAFRVVGATTYTLERQVTAEFDGKGKDHRSYFPAAPSAIISAPEIKRAEAFAPLLEAAGAAKQPKGIAPAAKTFVQAWSKYQTTEKQLAAAEKARDKARAKELEAKRGCIVAWRELEGRLQAKYPDDLKHVRSFFPKSKAPSKKPKADAKPEAPAAT